MHEIQSINGGVGRLFGRGGGGGGERRSKPHQYHQGLMAGGGHGYQALRCPRCDSPNTKFCYYNNYNLTQPRYFCKGCRRYWTKGGVLRNVPVGGGCRKNKRSNEKSSNGDPSTSLDVAPTSRRKSSDSQHSSSDSSSLTVNALPAKETTPTPFTFSESSPTKFLTFQESSIKPYTVPQSSTQNQSFPPVFNKGGTDNHPHHMFSEMEPFKSSLTSSPDQLPLAFNFNPAPELSSFTEQQDVEQVAGKPQEPKWKQWMEETYIRTGNGGDAADDWEGGGGAAEEEDGLLDESYWSQIPWSNHDHQLNFFH